MHQIYSYALAFRESAGGHLPATLDRVRASILFECDAFPSTVHTSNSKADPLDQQHSGPSLACQTSSILKAYSPQASQFFTNSQSDL